MVNMLRDYQIVIYLKLNGIQLGFKGSDGVGIHLSKPSFIADEKSLQSLMAIRITLGPKLLAFKDNCCNCEGKGIVD